MTVQAVMVCHVVPCQPADACWPNGGTLWRPAILKRP